MIWTILLVVVTFLLIFLNHIYSNVDSTETRYRKDSLTDKPGAT